jgi:chemotaxis protein histidine kinase CheA
MRRVGGHVSVTSEWGRGTTVDLLFPSLEPVELPG